MADFRMPSLGSDMLEGALIEWLVKPGDRVKRRDAIAVVETDKAAIEIEVYEDGVVETLLVQPGQKVAVGSVMAVIRTEVGAKAEAPAEAALTDAVRLATRGEGVPKAEKEKSLPSLLPDVGARRVKASPYARRLAAEHSVDLSTIAGTGPDGAIGAADIEKAAAAVSLQPAEKAPPAPIEETPRETSQKEAPPAAPAAERPAAKDYQTAMRRAIAAAMARSKREIPHYYLQMRLDMSRTLRWLESENLKRPIKNRILPVIPLIKAVSLALRDVPELNGYWIDDRHQISEAINLGFVIALRQGGLIAPAILDADEKCLDELMDAMRDLIMRTRSGGLRSSEMTDATVTVTNLGDLGVETVYGVIYPPQVALIGFGKTMEQPWAENGMLGVRPILTATLAADHRATDGHRGAQFLDALNRYLQEPANL
jgi:pyruvate dehydrogenase E2 component (dihydrolipoamide acetyltransferase)